MSSFAESGVAAPVLHRLCAVRRVGWWMALLPALMAAVWLGPATARAGTITIVDGPDTPPTADGVYTDGYINAQLMTGDLPITTTAVITGPNEIRVLTGAMITWSTGNELTLDAGSRIVITGTIRHDGPANGAGGVRLLTSGDPNGTVVVGTGSQASGVAVGSRFGLTAVPAGNLSLKGGAGGTDPFALLGFRVMEEGVAYTATGPISVTVSQQVTATAGATVNAFVQIGHGGADTDTGGVPSGNFSGPIAVHAGGDVTFAGGSFSAAYAQLGHGGHFATGSHAGDHTLEANGDVTFQGGSGLMAYAQLGNGGGRTDGSQSGNHRLEAGGDVAFQGGGGDNAYAQLGNGGYLADGNRSGSHRLDTSGGVTFQAGAGAGSYAQLGNGGYYASGSHSGNQTVDAARDVIFEGGGSFAYAQLGNGGSFAANAHSGDHRLEAGGDVTFQAGGGEAYAQLGNGGVDANGNQSGNHSLSAGGDVIFAGGSDVSAYAQFGNGGEESDGNHSGDLSLGSVGGLTVTLGSGVDAYAMLGHGSDMRVSPVFQGTGSRSGDIEVRVGETAVFSGSQAGHLTANGALSVTQGNTLIGVSRNNPFTGGAGQLLVTGPISSSFNSAPTVNGGELRIYLPRANSQQIPTTATFNGASFVVANTIPAAHLAGFAPFGDGPYFPDYSFYLGGQPDLRLLKNLTPAGPLAPGQAITYTVAFSNTGNVTATGVLMQDPLPAALTFDSATPQPDAGVTITPTAGAPNLAWRVSNLGIGKGGRIRIVAAVQNSPIVLETTFTNTATIWAMGDISLSNNSGAVTSGVGPGATLIITKTVVGDAPGSAWQFTGSGGLGDFNLPAAGGNQTFIRLLPATYTVTETAQAGYTATVSCTTGASGATSVSLTLAAGQQAGCTFTNTSDSTPVVTQTLTVNKVVAGGPLDADDFALFVDGAPVNRGAATSLSAGQHTVTETRVSTYTATFGGACNAGGVVNLAGGSHVTCTITNTYAPNTGAVTGLVYVDENGNGQPDTGEGLPGVTVTLQSAAGVVAALLLTDVTDAGGEYAFANVPAGGYTVSFAVPTGYRAIGDAPVTVTPGQTTTVADQVTTREGPGTLGDVYFPILQR